jgi:hypothetical protein
MLRRWLSGKLWHLQFYRLYPIVNSRPAFGRRSNRGAIFQAQVNHNLRVSERCQGSASKVHHVVDSHLGLTLAPVCAAHPQT